MELANGESPRLKYDIRRLLTLNTHVHVHRRKLIIHTLVGPLITGRNTAIIFSIRSFLDSSGIGESVSICQDI